jgi:glucose-1-phosphate thymidylyltransferase
LVLFTIAVPNTFRPGADVKGIVLAGGTGSRLFPLTRVTNKHLLPVYNRPMVFFPIQMLRNLDIEDILIVTGGHSSGDFLRLLQNGKDFGMKHLHYAYQEGEGGIAAALSLAEPFAAGDSICVVLGDNLIEGNVRAARDQFRRQQGGAHIVLKQVPDPQRFGCPEIADGRIVGIVEKPKNPPSNFAVTGIYFYDSTVFQKIQRLKPSGRGELEITDINNMYLAEGKLSFSELEGWWTDAGTFESLLHASNLVAKTGANKLDMQEKGAGAQGSRG